tara:strand:+ start:1840 stop:3057 length:1218 start_codon:yes stop_codon:yes gene_type:complete
MADFRWQVEMAPGDWEDYPDAISQQLEAGEHAYFDKVVNGQSNKYHTDPVKKQQTNRDSGKTREIRRLIFSTTWDCLQCTYKNPCSETTCGVCDTSKSTACAPVKRSVDPWLDKATLPDTEKERRLATIYLQISEHLHAGAPISDRSLTNSTWSLHRDIVNKKPVHTSAADPHCECKVCDEAFTDNFTSVSLGLVCGGSAQICHSCAKEHIKAEIQQENIVPWIKSPVFGLTHEYLPPDVVLLADRALILQFLEGLTSKMLSRCPDWRQCTECRFGTFDGQCAECPNCGNDDLAGKKQKLDDSLQKMIDDKQAVLCPSCNSLLVHSPAMCTLLTCQCGLVVNLVTGESGKSYSHLKDKARADGTLWHGDNLQKQTDLQDDDPAAFQKLLGDNGITFVPGYQRGQD